MTEKLFAVAKSNKDMTSYVFVSEKPLLEEEAIRLVKQMANEDDSDYFLLEFFSHYKRDYIVVEKDMAILTKKVNQI